MRISDWSSDVCSSDLGDEIGFGRVALEDRDGGSVGGADGGRRILFKFRNADAVVGEERFSHDLLIGLLTGNVKARSEERRVGQECVSTFRSGWSAYH